MTPRKTLILAAAVIELVALSWWPVVHLLDGSGGASRLGDMFLQRYIFLSEFANGVKTVVDWVLPGALWSWDALATFFVHSLILAFIAYAIAAWRLMTGHPPSARWVLIPLVLFQATLIAVPGSLTTDIFNYAIYGEMPVLYGANPFVQTPAEFPQSPLHYLIPLYWHDAPSVYGPFWILLSTVVATLFRPFPLSDELLFYRFIANVAHFANTALIWSIARRYDPDGRRAPSAALAYGWNPFLLLDFALNGHNDVLMLTLTLCALWLASARRTYLSAFALGLAVATKYTSVLIAPMLLLWSARQETSPFSRAGVATLTASGVILVAAVALLYSPWVEGIETFGPVLYWASGPRLQNFWPEPTLITLTAWISTLFKLGYADVWDPLLGGFKLAAKAALIACILVEAWHARTFDQVLGASARITIVFLLFVNTWVMPWYYTWPLALAAPLGWGSMLVRVCAGLTLTAPIIMYQRQFQYAIVGEWAGLVVVLPIALGIAAATIRRVPLTDAARQGRQATVK